MENLTIDLFGHFAKLEFQKYLPSFPYWTFGGSKNTPNDSIC